MAGSSRTSGNSATGIDDGVRKKIQSLKEIVGNHSDADIYAALKEANMDADETAQRLLLQDPFHEVKRRRDRKKEDVVFVAPASRVKPSEGGDREVKFHTQPERSNARRGGYSRGSFSRGAFPRNAFPRNSAAGTNREFRVVRDNRSNLNVDGELKHSSARSSVSNFDKVPANENEKGSAGGSGDGQPSGDQDSVHNSNARSVQAGGNTPNRKEQSKEKQAAQDATLPSSNSVVGVYSSSTDPVHVPSPDSRSSAIGAIRREVRVGSSPGKPLGNVVKDSSAPAGSFSDPSLRKDGAPQAFRPFSPVSKIVQLNQTSGRESVLPSGAANNRSLLNSHHGNRGGQYVRTHQQTGGHQKAVPQNKEWKPKSNQKSGGNNLGVIGTPKKASAASADNSNKPESDAVKLQDKLSLVDISERPTVIIAEHIRVPETDRRQLTFGSFVLEIDSSGNSASGFQEACLSEEHECESAPSLPVAPPEASNESAPSTMPVDILDDQVRSFGSGAGSPVSTASEPHLPEQKEDSRPSQNEFTGIELLSGNGPSYTSESKQQQDTPELQNFSAYDPQTGYDLPYFRPSMEENIRGQGLPSPQEAFNMHNTSAPSSSIPMLQQQQAQMAQMYPQVHVSHFPNLMPYRQFIPPVYVPQMPIQGYSGNPAAYAHPSNGNGYVLMPGGSSHLGANGIKYGMQQFKPVPTGGPTGFGSFSNPNGYPINSPSIVGNASGLEDSSRMKYKDGNIYVPNPQAESSEIWMQNPRDLTGLQSPPYYNVAGQTPHGAYISTNHAAHPSFNAAAAQSSHVQFQGLFHPPQPGAMVSPHHMGPGLGGNVGVGVAPSPPAAQVGTYQQPQLGHLNWPTNF